MKDLKNRKSIFDFPVDTFERMPGVYIYGISELLIDGRAELCDYSDACVIFDLFYRGLKLKIEGSGLAIRCAGKDVSEINGKIHKISYIRGSIRDEDN